MADLTYSDGQRDLAPGILKGPWAQKWNQSLGVIKDSVRQNSLDLVKCRFASMASEDALGMIGGEGRMNRAPGETIEEYRARVRHLWSTSLLRGTKPGLITQLNNLGLSNVSVYEAWEWGRWSAMSPVPRHWVDVVIDQPHPFGTDFNFMWGDGTLWGQKSWGANGDPRLLYQLQYVLQYWRPAHVTIRELIVILSGSIITGTYTASDGDPTTPGTDKILYIPMWRLPPL